MASRWCWILSVVTAGVGIALGTSALADSLPRLPGDFTFAGSDGSPGKVLFSHATHVDQKKPDCTTCHPALFRILEKGMTADGSAIRHTAMERGKACGACHDGKLALGLDNCAMCHRNE